MSTMFVDVCRTVPRVVRTGAMVAKTGAMFAVSFIPSSTASLQCNKRPNPPDHIRPFEIR